MDSLLGQMAALGASLAFSVNSTMFTLAGRKVGVDAVLRTSLPIGLVCTLILHWVTTGEPIPSHAGMQRWLFFGASAVIGFVAASLAIMNAFVLIGPRLALLITASAPILSSFLAWIFLDQTLEIKAMLGIALTLGGIAWVITEKGRSLDDIPPKSFRLGVILAFSAAIGQSFAFLFSTQGLADDFNPISGSLMRLIVGTAAVWMLAAFQGRLMGSLAKFREFPRAAQQMGVGAVSGPVIGALLVMVALSNAPVGIASTLTNLMPIFLIPISYVVFKERITRRAIIGTFIAVSGTAILFL